MNPEDLTIEQLILDGALEFGGIDVETGEVLYNFTDKLKQVMPDLYKEHLNFVNSEIMYLWEKGYLTLNYDKNESPVVGVAQKAFNDAEIAKLSKEKQRSLKEIMNILKVV
jgi:hypothetical protein